MRFLEKIFTLFFFVFIVSVCLGFLSTAFADNGRLPTAWKTNIEKSKSLQALPTVNGDSVDMIRYLVVEKGVKLFKYIFIGISLIFMAIYSYSLSIGMGEDEQLTEERKNFLFAIVGFAILGLAAKAVEIIDPYQGNDTFSKKLLDENQARSLIQTIITYLEMGLGIIAIVVLFYGALQMIMSDGDDEKSAMGKNVMKYGFLGIASVMLAEVLVNNVFYPSSAIEGNGVGDTQAKELISQGMGILKFSLEFLAVAVFISFLVSGFLYITAGDDDDQAEKGKKTLIWSAVGLILVISSYGLLTFFLGR